MQEKNTLLIVTLCSIFLSALIHIPFFLLYLLIEIQSLWFMSEIYSKATLGLGTVAFLGYVGAIESTKALRICKVVYQILYTKL